jgi:putative DNA primase/helicase
MTNKTKNHHWYANRYIDKFGMKLLPVKPSSKIPKQKEWGDTETPAAYWEQYPQDNIGLNLGASGFCSLDIDCLESFGLILEEFGIPLEELDTFPTIRGASKGKRLMFKLPEGVEGLGYHNLTWPKQDEPKKRFTVFEFRCAEAGGKARQDLLPPSIHPDTQEPYRWEVQPSTPWPEPPSWLISIVQAWEQFKPQLQGVCPWQSVEPKPERKMPPPPNTSGNDLQSVVDAYIAMNPLDVALDTYGYKRIGKRYLSPHSGTNLAGVIPFPDGAACWIHHASDPLCSEESGQPVSSYDLFTYYEHNGDRSAAFKAAMKLTGIKLERTKPTKPGPVASHTAPPELPPEQADEPQQPHQPFKALGYAGTSYYYLPTGTEQVCEIKRSGHTSPAELLSMAPLEWWEMSYPKEKGGADWHSAANDLMRACERAGIYSHERERGRGAWHDEGRAVLHLGDRLLVDAKPVSIHALRTNYIYTRQAPLEHGANAEPATDTDGATIADLIGGLNWSNPDHARLLAGWCFLAPICGALQWRPHVWLTAQRGAGKTWVQDHVINPLIGPAAMMVQGSTTEAGIRQRLKQDARPIVFDEAESEDQSSQKRMKTVIELARQSSSDSTAEIVKGTAAGGGMAFRMRSMFLLGSINVALNHAADESRFSVLSLSAPSKDAGESERFDVFSKLVDNTLTDDACAAIRARAYRLMPVIRSNAKTIARAVAEQLGSQRLGDQVGTLLAGDYCLRYSNKLTLEEARKWVFDMDFTEAKEAEQASDEEKCLKAIIEHQLRFDSDRGMIQRSIAEIIGYASSRGGESYITSKEANSILQRVGLRVESDCLMVANNHSELSKVLQNTPWTSGWRRVLGRLKGAKPAQNPILFAGSRSRATSVPISAIIN